MMLKRKPLAIVAVFAVLLLFSGIYLASPSKTPANQKPLLTLSDANLNEFVAAFDADTEAPRLLLLFSPT